MATTAIAIWGAGRHRDGWGIWWFEEMLRRKRRGILRRCGIKSLVVLLHVIIHNVSKASRGKEHLGIHGNSISGWPQHGRDPYTFHIWPTVPNLYSSHQQKSVHVSQKRF